MTDPYVDIPTGDPNVVSRLPVKGLTPSGDNHMNEEKDSTSSVAVGGVVRRLAAALGVERCRSATIHLEAGEIVKMKTEQFVENTMLDRLAGEIETGNYVVITRDEYDRLANPSTKWIADCLSGKIVGKRVLVRSHCGYVSIGHWLPNGCWYDDNGAPLVVSEWQPFPK